MQLSPFTWNLYRDSQQGRDTIESFDPTNPKFDVIKLLQLFNNDYASVISHKVIEDTIETLHAYSVTDYDEPTTIEEAASIYDDCVKWGFYDGVDRLFGPDDYQNMLMLNTPLSFEIGRAHV